MAHGVIKFGEHRDEPVCPICNWLLEGKVPDFICPRCHIHVKVEPESKPLTEMDMHADFCEDFRKYTENPKPKPRREEP